MTDRRRFLRILAAAPPMLATSSLINLGKEIPTEELGTITREVRLRPDRYAKPLDIQIKMPDSIEGLEALGVNAIEAAHREITLRAQMMTRVALGRGLDPEDVEEYMQWWIDERMNAPRGG